MDVMAQVTDAVDDCVHRLHGLWREVGKRRRGQIVRHPITLLLKDCILEVRFDTRLELGITLATAAAQSIGEMADALVSVTIRNDLRNDGDHEVLPLGPIEVAID